MNQLSLIKKAHFKSLIVEYSVFFIALILLGISTVFYLDTLSFVACTILAITPFIVVIRGSWAPKARGGGFSWDFIYSLPINKKEQLHLCAHFFALECFLIYYAAALYIGYDSLEDRGLAILALYSLVAIPVVMFLSFLLSYYGTKVQINYNRRVYQDQKGVIRYLRLIRQCGAFLLNLIGGLVLFAMAAGISVANKSKLISNEVAIGIIVILAAVSLVYLYRAVKKSSLNIFHNYKLSYSNPRFRPLRDGIFTCIALSYIVGVFSLTSQRRINRESHDFISQLVKNKEYTKLSSLEATNEQLNQTNSYGYNPYMMAVSKGDLKALKILESKGAKPSAGVQISFSRKVFNSFHLAVVKGEVEMTKYLLDKHPENRLSVDNQAKINALRLAASSCGSNEVLDYLLTLSEARVNSRNEQGETAMHLAAKNGCLTNIVSLSNAGAKRDLKAKNQHIAFDYIQRGKKGDELRSYFKKLDRSPASVKK